MNTTVEEKIFPFKWEGWDKQDELVNTYYNVTFTDNFGKFNDGDYLTSLTIDYGQGVIETYNDEGDVKIKQNFKAVAI